MSSTPMRQRATLPSALRTITAPDKQILSTRSSIESRKHDLPGLTYNCSHRWKRSRKRHCAALLYSPSSMASIIKNILFLSSVDSIITRASQQNLKTDYLGSLGIALEQQGLHDEALKALDRAVQLRPDDIGLWIHHGNTLVKLERQAEGIVSYQHALKLDPTHADAAYGCGCVLLNLGRMEEALCYFNLSDELRPNQAVVLEQRGFALLNLKRYEEALADYLRVH